MNVRGHVPNPGQFSFGELMALSNRTVTEISATAESRLEREEEMVETFMKHLLSNEGRFQRIFMTARGSMYFVAEDNASLRFRSGSQGRSKIQPVAAKHILIDRPAVAGIRAAHTEGNTALVGLELGKSPYEIGSIPFELYDSVTNPSAYDETDERLLLNNGAGRYHFGHEIVDIIK